jgi:D-alanyl-D-alanine carboxypeptidase/D-alanyl-D-alanine-endopeptidase (penicillin-binding protein 4)
VIARLVTAGGVLLAAAALSLPLGSATAAPTSFNARLTAALKGPGLQLGRTAAIAIDVDTGKVIYAHNATRAIIPASNEKLPIGWAALVRLGPNFRFRTELVGAGTRQGSTWKGNLILKGYGDPTFSTPDLEAIARTVSARGIRRVDGRVLGDESFFDSRRDAPGWKHGFLGIESAPLSALVLDRGAHWPKHSPPLLAAQALVDALGRRGISVSGRIGRGLAPTDGKMLARDESPPLSEIMRFLNRHSDNFTAEMLTKQLGTLDGRPGSTAGGLAVVMAEMQEAGIPTAGVQLVDGSGLSSLDRVTARALAGTLQAGLSNPAIAAAYVNSLAMAGGDGTLEQRLPKLGGRVRGKTGTTDLACSLSGLIDRRVAFVVIENGNPVPAWTARTAQDRFVTLLATQAS